MTVWDKITINGLTFYEPPVMCGGCPALIIGRWEGKGFCLFFRKQKSRSDTIPKRCSKLFCKGFAIGGDLVITLKDK